VVDSETELRLLPGNVLPESIRSILELALFASLFCRASRLSCSLCWSHLRCLLP
jgi:hypothetical protein